MTDIRVGAALSELRALEEREDIQAVAYAVITKKGGIERRWAFAPGQGPILALVTRSLDQFVTAEVRRAMGDKA